MLLALAFPLLTIALQIVSPPPPAPKKETTTIPLGDVAQRAARIAVKTAGLTESDAEIERMATRARASALLPEVRVMAKGISAGPRDYVSDTGTVATSYFGPSYSIEGSLTFHLERLAYSGQEARLERLRLERVEARSRITQRVIDEIARWSKATSEERDSPEGTDQHADATARRVAAQMALDVWTAGWFSEYLEGKAR
ncbi:MAG TPA: hypothetical protein VGH87_27860 [Polyangiaceae bacterium]